MNPNREKTRGGLASDGNNPENSGSSIAGFRRFFCWPYIAAGVFLKIRIHLNTNPEKKPVLDLGRRTREIPHGG